VPLSPMYTCKPWFLAEHDAQVKRDRDDDGVDIQPSQAERHRPAKKDKRNGDVHGVACVAIQTYYHQVNRWRPGRNGAFASDVEVPDAPQKPKAANNQRNKPKWLGKPRMRTGNQPNDWDGKGDNARQREEGQ
jgi:hypothetical protein